MSNLLKLGLGIISLAILMSCNSTPEENSSQEDTAKASATEMEATTMQHNQLTEAEVAAGWQLLFDGKSISSWRNFKKNTTSEAWKVEDGTLMFDPTVENGGDIITKQQFENFEFQVDWKISDCGNSGIIYYIEEKDDTDYMWQTGPEMQVLDNTCHPDAKITMHRAGDLYDLISCNEETVKPAGEWNTAKVVANNGKLEHWLNGKMVVSTTLWDEAWYDMIANSKFKDMPYFGRSQKGHIGLQDHDDQVWFRNIKVRAL